MAVSETQVRSALVTYFPMLIAVMSLLTSVYNGYLNNRFVEIIQRNLGRAEYMRSCKEIIDAYFQVKFRADLLSEAAAGSDAAVRLPAQVEARNAVNKLAALGTYLANMRDEATRARYTELSRTLERIVQEAPRTPPDQLQKQFEAADRLFSAVNDDCVRQAMATM
jgi:5'-deoxynucleotidase YfbR-like HD superfamily hydrolase